MRVEQRDSCGTMKAPNGPSTNESTLVATTLDRPLHMTPPEEKNIHLGLWASCANVDLAAQTAQTLIGTGQNSPLNGPLPLKGSFELT